jgi:hypothetical protein
VNIARVTDSSGRLSCVRIDGGSGRIGIRSLAAALRKLDGVSDLRLHEGWPLTRDDAIEFRLDQHSFVVDTPFADYCFGPQSAECPPEIFERLAQYLEELNVRWWQRLT